MKKKQQKLFSYKQRGNVHHIKVGEGYDEGKKGYNKAMVLRDVRKDGGISLFEWESK